MDLITQAITVHDTFAPSVSPLEAEFIPWLENVPDASLIFRPLSASKSTGMHCDATLYSEVQSLKEGIFAFHHPGRVRINGAHSDLLQRAQRAFTSSDTRGNEEIYNRARNQANPYETLGNGPFINRAGMKLAEMDAIFHLTGVFSLLKPQILGNFRYLDLAGGPGGWVQYLQYRLPASMGMGMTLRAKKQGLDWDSLLTQYPKSFLGEYGRDGTGNLYTNYDWLMDKVDKEFGVTNLTVADGGFETEDDDQEFQTSRLLLVEILLGVACTLPREGDNQGGNFVVKVFDTVSDLSAQLLYLTSLCFEKITLYKPCASRPASSEKYLICWGKRKYNDVAPYLALLQKSADAYRGKEQLFSSILSTPIPAPFMQWLRDANDLLLRKQERALVNIAKILAGEGVSLPKLDLHRVPLLFSIPSQMSERERYLRGKR